MSEHEKSEIQKIQKQNAQIAKTEQTTKEISEQDELTGAMLNQHITWMRRVLPNEADKKIMEFQSNLLKQKADSKLENHRMFYEFQRQSIKETLDAVLIEGKGFVRKKTSETFGLQEKNLISSINGLRRNYNTEMDAAWDDLENIKNPNLRKHNEVFLVDLTGKFFVDMNKLIDRYRQILDELV